MSTIRTCPRNLPHRLFTNPATTGPRQSHPDETLPCGRDRPDGEGVRQRKAHRAEVVERLEIRRGFNVTGYWAS